MAAGLDSRGTAVVVAGLAVVAVSPVAGAAWEDAPLVVADASRTAGAEVVDATLEDAVSRTAGTVVVGAVVLIAGAL